MLCTNPRPCSLLILGVGSLAGGGRRNAAEALWLRGICGPWSDFLGVGCIGLARPGVLAVVGDFGVEMEGVDGWLAGVLGSGETELGRDGIESRACDVGVCLPEVGILLAAK